LRLESGTLVISTDGLLERLGGTDQSAGRREIVKHLTSTKRHQPTSDLLSTRVPSRDDELAMLISYRPWDINELIWVDDDRERLRVQRSLEQWLTVSRLSDSPDGQLPRAQFAAIAVAELLDNVRQHAHGSNNAIVRAMRTSEFLRIEVIDDGIGPPPARIINERSGGVFELIRQVSDHRYIEEASPRGCLVGMVFKTLPPQGNQDSTT
jgi:anti-sigma regulatory factor (Ser/Thr protein kinase)